MCKPQKKHPCNGGQHQLLAVTPKPDFACPFRCAVLLSSFPALLLLVALCFPPPAQAAVIDHLIATVDGQVITLGDLEEDLKFQILESPLQPLQHAGASSDEALAEALQRRIERTLLAEQMEQFPEVEITRQEIDQQVELLQKGRDQAGGGEAFTKQLGLSIEQLRAHLAWQMKVLKFLNNRFRPFVQIDQKEVESYYQEVFLPELAKRQLPAPPLASVEEKIQSILIEEKFNQQIEEWLKSLKAAASIEILAEDSWAQAAGKAGS